MLQALKKGRFEPAYILLGDDSVMADEIIAQVRHRLIAPGLEPFDLERYQADDLSSDTVSPDVVGQHIRQPPAGSERRLVIVTGITREGKRGAKYPDSVRKEGIDRLLEHVARTPDSCTVVLTGLPHAPLTRMLTKLGLAGAVVDLRAPKPAELPPLVRHWADERGISMTPDAIRMLIDVSGSNTGVLRSEVDKLASSCAAGEKVTVGRVKELAGSTRGFRLWEYTNLLMRREPGEALAVLRRLEEWGEQPMAIIAWLTNAFINLVAARAGLISASDWRVRDFYDRWNSTVEVNRCLQQLYRINRSYLIGQPETFARFEAFTHCVTCPVKPDYCDLYADRRKHDLCLAFRPRRKKHA